MGLHLIALNDVATPKGTIVGSAFVKSAMTASSLCSYRAMRLCAQCGFDWECDREAVLASLEGIGSAVRQRIESASSIRIRPSVDVWSALEYAAHTRDVARFYGRRIHAVLAGTDRSCIPSTSKRSPPAAATTRSWKVKCCAPLRARQTRLFANCEP
jgi:hypothetical protein